LPIPDKSEIADPSDEDVVAHLSSKVGTSRVGVAMFNAGLVAQ
jgi:hypothetical protein